MLGGSRAGSDGKGPPCLRLRLTAAMATALTCSFPSLCLGTLAFLLGRQEQKRIDGTTREVKKVRKARNRRQEWNMMAYDKELRPDTRLSQSAHHGASSEGSLSPDTRCVCVSVCVCARVHACIVRVSGAWLPCKWKRSAALCLHRPVCFQTFLKDECCICFEFEILL